MSGQYFCLSYDETTNESNAKELRVGVRYWSDRSEKIVSSHLRTFFIGRATGEILSDKIVEAMDENSLPMKKIVMLGSDGPTVNVKILRLVNEKIKICRKKPLLDIGTCNLHIAHNAFSSGLNKFGLEAAELVVLVFNFFDGWPSRRQDFEEIQLKMKIETHSFIKHVPSRWLTLEGACYRLIEQWPAVKRYFFELVPKERKQLMSTPSYLKIKRILLINSTRAELLFVRNSAKFFAEFSRKFQKEEPLVHILHEELRTLAYKLLGRVTKLSTLKEKDVCLALLEEGNLLSPEDDNIVVGDDVIEELNLLKVAGKDRVIFLKLAQDHMVAACRHLLQKSALRTGSGLRYFRCLKPDERISTRSINDILAVARALPVDVDVNALRDEWLLLQSEKDAQGSATGRIDSYWAQFFRLKRTADSQLKYPNVAIIVKAALSVSHGQADIERGFSHSGRTLTEDRASMGERTLDAYMTVKSILTTEYQNLPYLVPVTNKLIINAQGAHSAYKAHLEKKKNEQEKLVKEAEEEERSKLEEAERKRNFQGTRAKIAEAESKLKEDQAEESRKRKTALKLLEEANKRLKVAIKNKDFDEISLAQAMIEAAEGAENEAQEKDKAAKILQSEIDKKKSKLMTDCVNKKN